MKGSEWKQDQPFGGKSQEGGDGFGESMRLVKLPHGSNPGALTRRDFWGQNQV